MKKETPLIICLVILMFSVILSINDFSVTLGEASIVVILIFMFINKIKEKSHTQIDFKGMKKSSEYKNTSQKEPKKYKNMSC